MSGELRIGVFSYRLPVAGEKRGGIERVAHDIAQGLAERGHHVTVWSHDSAPEGAAYRVEMLPWRGFTESWLGRRVTMGYLGNLLALLPRYRDADVILAHGDSLLLPILGKPVIRIMHGSALDEALHATNPLRFLLQGGVYLQELATAITQRNCVGVSENTRALNPFVRRTIPNGVDLTRFRPGIDERSAEPSVLFVGTMEGRKRGRFLLDAFRDEIRPRVPMARLHMISPPGPAQEGVEYHLGPNDEALAALYRQAWVFASPSTYEGFGLPYLEALASGTPVVATPNRGSREVLADGEWGIMASDREFGSSVVALLQDDRRREELAVAGLKRAKQYSLQRTIEAYDHLVRSVAERKG